jgi:hypothetical protein
MDEVTKLRTELLNTQREIDVLRQALAEAADLLRLVALGSPAQAQANRIARKCLQLAKAE